MRYKINDAGFEALQETARKSELPPMKVLELGCGYIIVDVSVITCSFIHELRKYQISAYKEFNDKPYERAGIERLPARRY